MNFTGQNILHLPQVNRYGFTFRNIVVDSPTSSYDIFFDMMSGTGFYNTGNAFSGLYVCRLNSGYVKNGRNQILSTYNTGEPFGISGWIDTNSGVNGTAIIVDGISYYTGTPNTNNPMGRLFINVSGSGSLECDLELKSEVVTYNLSVNDFVVQTKATGYLTSNANFISFGSDTLFYQSYETLLNTQGPVIAFCEQNIPNRLEFLDGDSSYQQNQIQGLLNLYTLDSITALDINTNRTFNPNNIYSLSGNNTITNFGNDFLGLWSGSGFYYEDTPSFLTLNYTVNKTDSLGSPLDKGLVWQVTGLNNPKSSYVTGFALVTGGEYLYPPNLKVSGYYYVTGLQQDTYSMLFSSGCTGNIPISFSRIGNFGTGATGYLATHAVLFQDIYSSGINTYYVVDSYQSVSYGTGYTQAPTALVRTGTYGANCYDVPLKFGYNQAWFRPFITSGTTSPSADYLTGTVLCVTGIVSTGVTGYRVTGLDITNIGFGYNTDYLPLISFSRQSGDNLVKNATGSFLMKNSTGTLMPYLGIEIRTGSDDWVTRTAISGYESLGLLDTNFSMRFTVSGADATTPWTGMVLFRETPTSPILLTNSFTFNHTYSSDPLALKKNDSVATGTYFTESGDLSFLVTQDELDTIYGGISFTNNGSFELGDVDF